MAHNDQALHREAQALGAAQVCRGGAGIRFYTFETKKRGALRTAGVIVRRSQNAALTLRPGEAEACARVALARKDAAARGKVALLGATEVCVLQAGQRGALRTALCGNAVAAAALVLNVPEGRLRLNTTDARDLTVEFHRSSSSIDQSWLVPGMTVAEFTWRNRRCFRVAGLNSYTLMTGGLPVGMTAETCWKQTANGQPNAKLAVFGQEAGQNHVVFYNASGRHGAAPMTGLASVAVAAHASRRFAAILGGQDITYQTAGDLETVNLPEIGYAKDGRLRIDMPRIDAFVTPLAQEVLS